MLLSLHIENIAIMDNVDIEFEEGFCVLTGETGAGKSILIDSINLLTGERSSKELVRTGAEKAYVEGAVYTCDPTVCQKLSDAGIAFEEGEPIVLSREISKDGRSVVRINGRMSTTGFLKDLCKDLINIHGQKDSQSILDEAFHGAFLDGFAHTEQAKEAYKTAYKAVTETRKKLAEIKQNNELAEQKKEILSYQVDELKKANLRDGEEEELNTLRARFLNSETVLTALNECYAALCGDEEQLGALDLLENGLNSLTTLMKYDPEAEGVYEKLENLKYELEDCVSFVRDAKDSSDLEDVDINAVEGRLDTLSRLKRKYGDSVAEMLETLERLEQELYGIENADYLEQQLKKTLKEQEEVLKASAEVLTAQRQKGAKALSEAVVTALAELDMEKTEFKVELTPCELNANGAEKAEFLIAPNRGESLKPLTKIASGGELSRVILALKAALSEVDTVSTMIFDEVDTGVSGRAAQKIAEKIKKLSENKQIFVITHLAQVAAFGQHHYKISKQDVDGKTRSQVEKLDEQGRVQELARIMSGTQITESSISAAKELLEIAGRA
ncbi:MAG: DNA repair protein RecN [Clostridia bacterium]|nr:DNA repair protein RecN [Clostridia bacterium]